MPKYCGQDCRFPALYIYSIDICTVVIENNRNTQTVPTNQTLFKDNEWCRTETWNDFQEISKYLFRDSTFINIKLPRRIVCVIFSLKFFPWHGTFGATTDPRPGTHLVGETRDPRSRTQLIGEIQDPRPEKHILCGT